MEELESQIAKVTLGNFKQTTSFVHVMAEKGQNGQTELYMVAELPLLNPAAFESCQQIALSIASTLKRMYRKPSGEESFEGALAQINDELSKLAGMGQIHWVNKLCCIVAAKDKDNLSIATCGKVTAFLLRRNEFTDISCSPPQSHPLKTFENFSAGKIRLNDLILLSTTQLFNYLSIDRLKTILTQNDFLNASQTIIELLKENAGPQVAFGMLLNLQVPPGQTKDEEIDLEEYAVTKPVSGGAWDKIKIFVKAALALDHRKRTPDAGMPKISFSRQAFVQKVRNLKSGSLKLWDILGRGYLGAKSILNFREFKTYTPQKKFFLICAGILLAAFIANIALASHYKKVRLEQAQINQSLETSQKLLSDSQASLLYNDRKKAASILLEAQNKLPASEKISKTQKEIFDQTVRQIDALKQKLENVTDAQITNLGNLGPGENLIKLPQYLAMQVNGAWISFNKESGQIQDGKLQLPQSVISCSYSKDNLAAIYDNGRLFVWDLAKNSASKPFGSSVPGADAFGGMSYYSVNNRVYVADKSAKQVVSFQVSKDGLSRPLVAVKSNENLNGIVDLAVDGNVYVLTKTGVQKFLAGNPAQFDSPFLFKPFSGTGKIYSESGWQYLYMLDAGNNRIIISDKRGNVATTLVSSQFTKMSDFAVDEKNKTIYVLNDGNLLKTPY